MAGSYAATIYSGYNRSLMCHLLSSCCLVIKKCNGVLRVPCQSWALPNQREWKTLLGIESGRARRSWQLHRKGAIWVSSSKQCQGCRVGRGNPERGDSVNKVQKQECALVPGKWWVIIYWILLCRHWEPEEHQVGRWYVQQHDLL